MQTRTRREEGDDIQTFLVRMPSELHEALRVFAHATDKSMNDTVVRALTGFLSAEGRREEMDALIEQGRQRHRVALDKLADL